MFQHHALSSYASACALQTSAARVMLVSVKKTLLQKMLDVGVLALRAQNQETESSFPAALQGGGSRQRGVFSQTPVVLTEQSSCTGFTVISQNISYFTTISVINTNTIILSSSNTSTNPLKGPGRGQLHGLISFRLKWNYEM